MSKAVKSPTPGEGSGHARICWTFRSYYIRPGMRMIAEATGGPLKRWIVEGCARGVISPRLAGLVCRAGGQRHD